VQCVIEGLQARERRDHPLTFLSTFFGALALLPFLACRTMPPLRPSDDSNFVMPSDFTLARVEYLRNEGCSEARRSAVARTIATPRRCSQNVI
jgi:hypothetical protein